jgi:uncharacterized protein
MKTLVIGASTNPERYSNKAIVSLLNNNHQVVAIGNKAGNVLGVEIETKLIAFSDIDTITLYLNPLRQEVYYDYILSLNPKRVIFNPGTENPELYKLLTNKNIGYEIACTLVLLATGQY